MKDTLRSATPIMCARMANMALGLLALPLMIRWLGGSGFAAWALLLALGAGFSLLEAGLQQAAIRFIARPLHEARWRDVRAVFGHVWLLLALSFGIGAGAVALIARPLAGWLGLPATPWFAPHEAILWVFAAVAARAFLQGGSTALMASRRFGAASAVSLLQSLASNLAALAAAALTGRLDLAVIAFWSAQLLVLATTMLVTARISFPRFAPRETSVSLAELLHYGWSNQMEGWAHFINFQFDKFLVAGLIGLWGVAPYEVANRAVAALRSVPASGADTLLPRAMLAGADREAAWRWYIDATRLAAYGAIVFLIAPLAIAPAFLYAWTGEMGHVARWVFFALALGATASVLALPAGLLAQAEGLPLLQGRAAAVSIALNIPLSLALVMVGGLVGAAIGTAIAMAGGALWLLVSVHRHLGKPLQDTWRTLASFAPLVALCLAFGLVIHLLFGAWFDLLPLAQRFSRHHRLAPGIAAIAAYLACLASLAVLEWKRGRVPWRG